MPELPDVEVFRQYIDATALHQPIRDARLHDADQVMECAVSKLKRRLAGNSLEKTRRHGKHLGVRLNSDDWLLLHFGMTGYLDDAKCEQAPPEHTRLVLRFDNGFRLAYVNQRKLGRIRLADDFDEFIAEQELGPDTLEMNREAFQELLSDGHGTLKARLMNQGLIAGLGNVYTDELFFQAGVYPGTHLEDITPETAGDLWRTMRHVLRTATKRRAQPERMPRTWLTPHRGEEECPRCHGPLEQAKMGGRTSRYCPACQS
jgi:formamidopyrimidine-DNA glycosylase